MLKTQIFAMMFVFMFMPGMGPMNSKASPAPKNPVKTVTKAHNAKVPTAFRGFSSRELATLKKAAASVNHSDMTKIGEIKKDTSTFTWEYLLIFVVLAIGAAVTLLVI